MIQHIDRAEVLSFFGNRCALCGDRFENGGVHIHHAVIFLSDLPRSRQHNPETGYSVNMRENLLPVHPEPCHKTLQSNRQLGQFIAAQNYGIEPVRALVENLCPKTRNTKWGLLWNL